METAAAPVLSTPEHILENIVPATAGISSLSDDQLDIQYEIRRTIQEIRHGQWKRIALQFPDDMLVDAPRVFERLRNGLRTERNPTSRLHTNPAISGAVDDATAELESTALIDVPEKLTILADTSYGACCVDEVAAEHVDAEVVVHYGRSCLSLTARLPVIYVFTPKPVDLDAMLARFKKTYLQMDEKVILMADVPYSHHVSKLYQHLTAYGYRNLFPTEVKRDPSSLIPNRTIPSIDNDQKLTGWSVFHISNPPTSLLLILSSRVKSIHILPTENIPAGPLQEASASATLRRRYALVTRLPAIPVLGILINTLSVSTYMTALQHCQKLILQAGKKSYTVVVGKVNPAKLANFAEIGAWVVIGCWESSLIESREFLAPLVTPFELDIGLMGDHVRQWGGEWISNFQEVVEKAREHDGNINNNTENNGEVTWEEGESDDEPPDFDLRTGRYVSRSRPMGRQRAAQQQPLNRIGEAAPAAPPSSALVQRAKGDLATINGTISPAAEFLQSKRTWQGLGSDYEVLYERDEHGRIRGAGMEEGRQGVARGYAVGDASEGSASGR